jgi:hypothetical protein
LKGLLLGHTLGLEDVTGKALRGGNVCLTRDAPGLSQLLEHLVELADSAHAWASAD